MSKLCHLTAGDLIPQITGVVRDDNGDPYNLSASGPFGGASAVWMVVRPSGVATLLASITATALTPAAGVLWAQQPASLIASAGAFQYKFRAVTNGSRMLSAPNDGWNGLVVHPAI